ncbi:hypothetical protein K501DRAFT_130299, partial [Backusella circina FSU 941]
IDEIDGVFVPRSDVSTYGYTGTLVHKSTIVDRKSRYFDALGMNGILDINDEVFG